MIHYRTATIDDTDAIALLHAQSWQVHYRGIFRDQYLDNEAIPDRRRIWQERMGNPSPNQYVVVAESAGTMCGFACIYANHDPVWGAFLDNLHVVPAHQGHGIGRALMQQTAAWIQQQNPYSKYYLWVLEENKQAIGFYERLGAILWDKKVEENPGGGRARIIRCVWEDLASLLSQKKL